MTADARKDLGENSRRALAAAPDTVHAGMSLFLAWRISDRHFAEALSEFDLNPRQYSVLLELDADAPLSQRELIDRVGLDRSGMGRHLDELERRGFVIRKSNGSDRRAHAVQITGEGRRRLHAADPAVRKTLASVYSALSDEDLTTLDRLLSRIVEQY